jgi:hypothetical protein
MKCSVIIHFMVLKGGKVQISLNINEICALELEIE